MALIDPRRSSSVRANERSLGRALRPYRRLRPRCELVEDRTLLSTVTWINANSGDWDTASNWNTNKVPTSADDVVIPIAGITVTHIAGDDSARSLDSKAAFTMEGGSLTFGATATFENTLEVAGESTLNGTVGVSGTMTIDSGATLKGSGAVTVSGLLALRGGDTVVQIASLDAKGGMDYDASGDTFIGQTQVTLEANSTFHSGTGNIRLSNQAAITNIGSLSVDVAGTGGYTVEDDDPQSTTSFTNQGTITKTGVGGFGITTDVAVNDGSINVQAGTLQFSDELAKDKSTGSFAGASGTTLQLAGCVLGANSSVTSTGTVALQDGLAVGGLYKVQAPGGTTVDGKTSITGDLEGLGAFLTLDADANLDLSPTVGPGTATVGTLALGQDTTLSGTLALIVTGQFTWHSAFSQISIASIDAKGGLDYDASGVANVSGTQMTLEGSSTFHTGTGSIYLAAGAAITNLGTLTADSVGTDDYYVFGADAKVSFTNGATGKITKTGDGIFGIQTDTALNNGTITVQGGTFYFEDGQATAASTGGFLAASGTTLQLGGDQLGPSSSVVSSGTVELFGGVAIAGLYNVEASGATSVTGPAQITGNVKGLGSFLTFTDSGSAVISPSAQTSPITVATLTTASFISLAGTLKLTVSTQFNWHSHQITIGIASLDVEGETDFDASDSTYLIGTQLTLAGDTQFHPGSGGIAMSQGASITNTGTMTIATPANDSELIFGDDTDAGLTTLTSFTNEGTMTKTGAGSFAITTDVAVNSGTIDVQAGSFTFKDRQTGDASSGSFTAAAGTTLRLAGCTLGSKSTISSSGTVELLGSVSVGGKYTVSAPGGTLVSGAAQLTGDVESLGNTLTLADFGDLLLSPSAGPLNLTVDQLTIAASAQLTLGRGAGVQPAPRTFITHYDAAVQGPTLTVNNGVTNPGTIVINAGSTLSAPTYNQTGGSTVLGGGMLTGGPVVLDGGEIEGPGTIGDDLTNTGDLVMGGTDLLTILGNFIQTITATLDIVLIGATAGGHENAINVKGTAQLAGTLKVHLATGYTPAPGDQYRVLTFDSRSGDFATKMLNVLDGEQLTAAYDATGLTLTAPANGSSTTLSAPTAPVASGAAVTLTATVTNATPGGTTPSGSVTFMDGSTTLGTASLVGGVATYSTTGLNVGKHVITAVYAGSAAFIASVSPEADVSITDALGLTTPAPGVRGSITATVSGSNANGSTSLRYVWTDSHAGSTSTLITDTSTKSSDTIDLSGYSINKGDVITCTVTPADGTPVVSAQVTVADSAPVAADQAISLNENGTATITLPASDVDHDALTYAVVGGPSHGALTRKSNGVYIYTPTRFFNGTDSLTFTASDGSLSSNVAIVAITVLPVNQSPVATAQTVTTSDSTGQALVTLKGTDQETVAAQLIYKVISLPASGTLLAPNGTAVKVGQSFVGTAAALTYVLPSRVLGNFSTSFRFTVTDTGDPPGHAANTLTSKPATVTIQTPARSAGVLRITGPTGNPTITLSKSAKNSALHLALNGAALGTDLPFSSIKAIRIVGRGKTDTFNVPAGLPVPVFIQGGPGTDILVAGVTSLTFDGGASGKDSATITTSTGKDTATLRPRSATVSGPGYTVNLTNVPTITVHGDSKDTANLFDSPGNDTFSGQPTTSVMSGANYTNKVTGFGTVNATASKGTDQANLTDGTLGGSYSGSGKKGTLSGRGYTINVAQFSTVKLDGRSSAKNSIHVSALAYILQKLGKWVAN